MTIRVSCPTGPEPKVKVLLKFDDEIVTAALAPDSDPWCEIRGRTVKIRTVGTGSAKAAVDDVLRCASAAFRCLEVVGGAGRVGRGPTHPVD